MKPNNNKTIAYKRQTRAYKHVPLDIEVLSSINKISEEENMSFNDVINLLLREALHMNNTPKQTGEQ